VPRTRTSEGKWLKGSDGFGVLSSGHGQGRVGPISCCDLPMRPEAFAAALMLVGCARSAPDTNRSESALDGRSPAPEASSRSAAPSLRAGPHLFVSNEASGDVSVIALPANEVVATIPVGKRPRGIQRSPDGTRVYMTLSGSVAAGPNAKGPVGPPDRSADGIGVLDARTAKLIDRLPSGTDPEQFALDASGAKLFVSNEDAASVSMIDIASKRVDATLAVGEEPEGVASSPDGRWVYVTSESSHIVSVIDVRARAVVGQVRVDARPRSVAFAPDSSKAYVTSEVGGTVAVIGLPQHAVRKTLRLEGEGVRPMGIAIASNGKSAYVTTGHGGTVAVIDATKDEVVGSIQVGSRPWGIAISPDGGTLYTANGFSDDVSVVDVASATVTHRVRVGSRPWGVVYVP